MTHKLWDQDKAATGLTMIFNQKYLTSGNMFSPINDVAIINVLNPSNGKHAISKRK